MLGAAGNRNSALAASAADPLIIDIDATLVTLHADKENVAGTYKGGYGFAPFVASAAQLPEGFYSYSESDTQPSHQE